MEEKVAALELKHIAQLEEELKKEIIEVSHKMLTIFVDSMNGKPLVDALNIGVNSSALLVTTLVKTLSNDYESQRNMIGSIEQFIQVYHLSQKKKEESC